jgi:antirestriction protein ArdC
MAAAFLCGHAQIHPPLIENQAAYIDGWIRTIKGHRKLIIGAASAAQKACDWIRGERGDVTG